MPESPVTPAEMVSKLNAERRPRPMIGDYSFPEGDVERVLSELWSQVLRIDRIGRLDNLFDLGGDSLNMMQLSAQIRRRFGVEIAIDEFFEDPTIATIASLIAERTTE